MFPLGRKLYVPTWGGRKSGQLRPNELFNYMRHWTWRGAITQFGPPAKLGRRIKIGQFNLNLAAGNSRGHLGGELVGGGLELVCGEWAK